MKKIETFEQRQAALAWMVEHATHPLEPLLKDPKKMQVYDYLSEEIWRFDCEYFKGSEYPPLDDPEPEKEDKPITESGWFG